MIKNEKKAYLAKCLNIVYDITSVITGGNTMVMEPISVDRAIEIAKKKRLRAGRVRGTDGVCFTNGSNQRLEEISWDEFKKSVEKKSLQIFESGGWMKIMKRKRK